MRVTEAALLQLKAQMHQQHVNVRAGYSTPNELVEWVVQNVTAALEEEFPRRRVSVRRDACGEARVLPVSCVPQLPSPHMLWTINSQSYAAIRKQFVVTWPYYIAAMQRVVSYATSSAAPARPFCVVGPHGSGKSHLIALSMSLLYDQTRPLAGEHVRASVGVRDILLTKDAAVGIVSVAGPSASCNCHSRQAPPDVHQGRVYELVTQAQGW